MIIVLKYVLNIIIKMLLLIIIVPMLLGEDQKLNYSYDCKMSKMLGLPEKKWEDYYESPWYRIKKYIRFKPL